MDEDMDTQKWLKFTTNEFIDIRTDALFCPISEKEILIVGGCK